jgi:hypothetical protein
MGVSTPTQARTWRAQATASRRPATSPCWIRVCTCTLSQAPNFEEILLEDAQEDREDPERGDDGRSRGEDWRGVRCPQSRGGRQSCPSLSEETEESVVMMHEMRNTLQLFPHPPHRRRRRLVVSSPRSPRSRVRNRYSSSRVFEGIEVPVGQMIVQHRLDEQQASRARKLKRDAAIGCDPGNSSGGKHHPANVATACHPLVIVHYEQRLPLVPPRGRQSGHGSNRTRHSSRRSRICRCSPRPA